MYVSCGRKITLGWAEMSDAAARELHVDLRERIRGSIPRQVMIDDFWIGLRHEAKFTKSYDQYHFGCMVDAFTAAERQEVSSDLARRLGKMLDDAVRVAHALDYPWTEIWGEAIEKRKGSKIVSPRSLYGEAIPLEVAQPSSGVTPRALRQSRVVGVTPRRRAATTVWRTLT